MKNCVSIGKIGQGQVNEDAVRAEGNLIAVSDGAGGGGIYADLWSAYLVAKLPLTPITSFAGLDGWIDGIWESFYNDCEQCAQKNGGMVLNKFYDEGSFATLAAAWKCEGNVCHWMAYGDSVVFHYDMMSGKLEHSFTRLSDFNRSPYLINCKDNTKEAGFCCGSFSLVEKSIVFCATDALAHYILMMYESAHRDEFCSELTEASTAGTKLSAFVNVASVYSLDFYKDVVLKLKNCVGNRMNFSRHIEALLKRNLIAVDDYSFAISW